MTKTAELKNNMNMQHHGKNCRRKGGLVMLRHQTVSYLTGKQFHWTSSRCRWMQNGTWLLWPCGCQEQPWQTEHSDWCCLSLAWKTQDRAPSLTPNERHKQPLGIFSPPMCTCCCSGSIQMNHCETKWITWGWRWKENIALEHPGVEIPSLM